MPRARFRFLSLSVSLSVVLWALWNGVPAVLAQTQVPAQDWVSAAFPARTQDLGTVARGSKIRHTFDIINNTNSDIEVADIRTKCGCTEVRVGSREIPPGTRTVVEAYIDTTKFQGYKASGLTLILSKPAMMEVDYNLSCFIRTDVVINPGAIDFGTVARGTSPQFSARLSYAGGNPNWAIVKMNSISSGVSAKLVEISRSANGVAEYEMTATLNGKTPAGTFKDEFTLYTNDPNTPKIPVSVTANVQSSLTISPSILNIGRVKAGSTVTKTLLIRSTQPFQIKEFQSPKHSFEAKLNPGAPRTTHPITLTFKVPMQTGPFHDVVKFETSLPNEPSTSVSTFATIEP